LYLSVVHGPDPSKDDDDIGVSQEESDEEVNETETKSDKEEFDKVIEQIAHDGTPTKAPKKAALPTSPSTATKTDTIAKKLFQVAKAPSSSPEAEKPLKKKAKFSAGRTAEKETIPAKIPPSKKRAQGNKLHASPKKITPKKTSQA
jgi:hypothetical protein